MGSQERILKQYLETEKAFGVEAIEPQWIGRQTETTAKSQAERASGVKTSWTILEQKALGCTECRLSDGRTHVVFGEGNPNAELLFVGEAPGYEEDQQGRPFVGKAGQLLTKIIAAMGLKREDVYIANCVKCRPQQNRNPLPDEIATCNPILTQQIQLIGPKVICALGKFAAQTLLQTEKPISRLRGQFYECHGVKLMPTFHPAYLLRNPADKKLVWQDIQQIMAELGLPLPQRA